ncbi:S-protein-like protein 5-like [Senna tora]|uniref:S-protein homolog n=1 Tax=Senna tora TaxID=362788 RepID=A0A834WBH7_9FABA|nr:S-protein-like protein 5-like [Senna tora]
MASLTKSLVQILLGILIVAMFKCGKGEGIMYRRVKVQIINNLTQPQDLTLHCKSKTDDRGEHTIKIGETYEFKFWPNFFYRATLYFCSFWWQSNSSFHHFDIYDQKRDSCVLCTWKILEIGACTYYPAEGTYTDCYRW